jgi:hypothetical protein
VLRATAEHAGVCVRPVLLRRTDRDPGRTEIIEVPCGARLAAKCKCCPAFKMPMKAALWMPMWWGGNAPPVVFRRGVGWCGVAVRGRGAGG